MKDKDIEDICNKVENIIEQFVIENRGKLFKNGMEKEIILRFKEYMKKFLSEEGIKIENIDPKQNVIIKNRLGSFLEFARKIYYS